MNLKNLLVAGAHWFAWGDEPVLGRMDGENYNICDEPPLPRS
jgi:hypothetical protein